MFVVTSFTPVADIAEFELTDEKMAASLAWIDLEWGKDWERTGLEGREGREGIDLHDAFFLRCVSSLTKYLSHLGHFVFFKD